MKKPRQRQRDSLDDVLDQYTKPDEADSETMTRVVECWDVLFPGRPLTDYSRQRLALLLREFRPESIVEAMGIASKQYVELGEGGLPTEKSATKAFNKLGGICRFREAGGMDRETADLYRLRSRLSRRVPGDHDEYRVLRMLKGARRCGVSVNELEELVRDVTTWADFEMGVAELSLQVTTVDRA